VYLIEVFYLLAQVGEVAVCGGSMWFYSCTRA